MSDRLEPRRWTSTLREIGLDRDAGDADLSDALGVRRLRFRRSSDRHLDPATGAFVVLHRAVVWDPLGGDRTRIEAWSAASRDAALAEALGRFLAAHPRAIGGPRRTVTTGRLDRCGPRPPTQPL